MKVSATTMSYTAATSSSTNVTDGLKPLLFANKYKPNKKNKVSKAQARENIKTEIKRGTLTLSPEKKFFFGLFKTEAEYTYITNGRETPADIRAKFNLKDGALLECNPYIVDANEPLPKGQKIYFYKKDVQM